MIELARPVIGVVCGIEKLEPELEEFLYSVDATVIRFKDLQTLTSALNPSIDLAVIDDALLPDAARWLKRTHLRERVSQIVLVNVNDEYRCAVLLDAGADEALVRGAPTGRARLACAARRALGDAADAEWQLGDIRISLAEQRMWQGRNEVHLTTREWQIIRHLVQGGPEPVSLATLTEGVWGTQPTRQARSRTYVYVNYIRRKLSRSRAVNLECVKREGYRLVERAVQ